VVTFCDLHFISAGDTYLSTPEDLQDNRPGIALSSWSACDLPCTELS